MLHRLVLNGDTVKNESVERPPLLMNIKLYVLCVNVWYTHVCRSLSAFL